MKIEINVHCNDIAEAAAAVAALATIGGTVSAAVTAEKQDAARASTGKGKDKAKDEPKVADKPKDEAPKYEASGLPEKIAAGVKKDAAAMRALLTKFGGVDTDGTISGTAGKVTGKALKPEVFEAFRVEVDALLAAEAPADDMG